MFSQGITKGTRTLIPSLGILWGNEYTRCDERDSTGTEDRKEDWFQGQCLKRQLWRPKLPYPAWDYDWDGHMVPDTTLEAQAKGVKVRGKTRHIILIRHGQYHETHMEEDKRKLTELGRMQAELTGRRLAIMAKGFAGDRFGRCNIIAIRTSGMTRAKETAEIISKHLPGVEMAKADPMLNEALPAPIIPIRPEIDAIDEIDGNSDRIEAAFHKYMYRASPSDDDEHEFEVIVCHGNVIRYFFCRALQIPPEAWLRMSIFNCSLTYIMIKPNGYCSCRLLGDVGHLGYEHTTFSNGYGFAWS